MSWESELLKFLLFGGLFVFIVILLWKRVYPLLKDLKESLMEKDTFDFNKPLIVYVIFVLSSFNFALLGALTIGFVPPYYINEYLNFFGDFESNLSFITVLSAMGFYFSFFYGPEVSKQLKLVSLCKRLGFPEWNRWNRREWIITFIGELIIISVLALIVVIVALLFQRTGVAEPVKESIFVPFLVFITILSTVVFIVPYFGKEKEYSLRNAVEEEVKAEQSLKEEETDLVDRLLTDVVIFIIFFLCIGMLIVALGVNSLITMDEYQFTITVVVVVPSTLLFFLYIIDNHAKKPIIGELVRWLKWLISDTTDDVVLDTKDVITLLITFLYLAFGLLWLVFVHPHPSLLLLGTTFFLEIYFILLLLSLIRVNIPLFTDFIGYLSTRIENLFKKEAEEGSHPYYWPVLLFVAISLSLLWLHAFYSTI